MKCKRKKATFGVLAPNIQRGGMAIPLGNNLYWMKGRKHKTGGIDIGKDLEVENNEVMQMLPNETRVFSSVKMLGGNSPAELVASGMNPNMVFNAQEEYKRINRIKDDGSRYKRGGRKRADDGTSVETNNFARILYNNRYRNNKSTSLKMNNEEKVLTMANYVRPKNNYEYAVDGEDNYLFPFRKLANTAGLPSGLSNCTLTVSQLYNPARPINHARTITKNPRANGFYEVTPDYAIPGSMVIASNNLNDDDENNVYHTMVLTGFADKDYTYNFNGNSYKIKKGAPLVSYSRGGNNVGDWRTNIPLDVYMDNSNGKNFVRYYRPLDKNGNPNVLLDELTVQPKKYGGRKRAKYGYDENGNPIYGLTREYPIPLSNINVIGNLDTLRKAKALFRDDEQRRIMLDQEYDVYRNNVSREFLNYIDEFYNNDEFKQSKLNGTLDRNALERLEEGIEIEPTVDQVIDNLYYLKNKTNDVYVTPYNYEIDELPESNEVKRNDEAYRSWYLGNNKNDVDTIFVPRVDNFNNLDIMDNYISEFSHHLQSQPGNEILMGKEADKFYEDEYGNYKPVQEVYDIPGYVEFNAHKIIEPLLRNFIYSNYDGDKELRDNAYNAIMNIMKKQANEVKIKKYGGKMNLQNIDNPLARNNKRMISPNKLGTIVRVDGNGRDRLAYIPSTGSSKQDMKCGGRVKAETGLSWGYYPPRDGLLFGEDIDYNTGRDNTSYRVPLFASNDNRITGLRLPTLGYLRPSDTFLANWMTSANANNRDGVVNTQEPYGYVPRYSHLRLDTNSDNNNTSGSWSQFLTNLDTPTLIDKRTNKTDGANVYSTKKSDSVSPQSTNRKGISSYLDIVNDITKGESDWQGYAAAGVNALGSIVNSLIMNNALRKQRPPVRPVPKIAQKLKTKYNINPQLSENREATAQAVKDVLRNTASSQVGRNLVNSLGLQRAIADNKLFAEKENKETELINKDIVNRQSVDHENVDTYNKWLEARNDFYNNRSLLRAQNWASLVNGLGSAIGAGLGNIGASRRYRNNVLLAMLPYIKATGNG